MRHTLGFIPAMFFAAAINFPLMASVLEPVSSFPSYLDGLELPDLAEKPEEFRVTRAADVYRCTGPFAYLSEVKSYWLHEVEHLASGEKFRVFGTFRDEDDGGNTLGWVESPQGEVLAEVADGFFYEGLPVAPVYCVFQASGK